MSEKPTKHKGTLWVLPSRRRFDFKTDEGKYLIENGIIDSDLSEEKLCNLAGKRCEVVIGVTGNLLHAEALP